MTKVRLGNLCLAAAVAGVILCAVLMRAFYMPYSGFWRTVLYNILIFSWAVSVWWRILHAQTRRCLLGAAALMLFWLDIRLIRYDFAQTPEMLRRLWYAYYIPMLLIPTLALYTLFFLDRGQSAPLYKYRYVIFVFPVVLFSLVLTNDCHQLVFAFPPGQEVLGSPDYTYRFVYYLCLLWIFSCAVFTVVYLVRRCRIPHTKRILWLPLVPIFWATLYALLYKHILNVPWMSSIFRLALAMLWACRSFSTAACISALTGVAFSRLRFVLRGLCPSAITLTRTDPGNIFPLTFTLSSPLKADYIQKCYLLSSAQRSVSTGHLRVVSGLLHRPPFGVTFPQFRVVFKERPYNFSVLYL